jgi:hypothetical protein
MIARVLKKRIEENYRKEMKDLKFSTQEPFLRVTSRCFHEVFRSWETLKAQIEDKYIIFLTEQPTLEMKVNALKVSTNNSKNKVETDTDAPLPPPSLLSEML